MCSRPLRTQSQQRICIANARVRAVVKRRPFPCRVFCGKGLNSVRNSFLLSYDHGDEGSRTPDPLLARQVLSQLSYTPGFWHPPDLPCRLQHSTFGRLGLNHRVRDENGCFPKAHQHQKSSLSLDSSTAIQPLLSSLERR